MEKLVKVHELYNIANKLVKQFGYWHKYYVIEKQMTHYFGMHSAKQIMRNKGTQFGYKKFVLTSWDGYPYHKIPYCVAKGIAETAKDGGGHTLSILLVFWSELFEKYIALANQKMISLYYVLSGPLQDFTCTLIR